MGFSKSIKEDALVAAARHCCVCHRLKGLNIEVHHIKSQAQGGKDTFDNAIALCPDCHADSGHYFANHPRGTKLSPSELVKHRDEWYEIVKKNNIEDTEISDHIHCRHVIFDNCFGTLNGDFSNNIIKNPVLFLTSVGFFLKKHLNTVKVPVKILSEKITYADYKRKYPLAIENGNHGYLRIPSDEELVQIKENDSIIKYLHEKGIPNNSLCHIFAYDNNFGCGGDIANEDSYLIEGFLTRKYYLQTLVITNISTIPISLKNLYCSKKEVALQKTVKDSQDFPIQLPRVEILPQQSVIIPTAIIGNGLDILNFEFIKNIEEVYLENWYESISQTSIPESEIEYVGDVYEPYKITYQIHDNIKEEDIHKINYKSLYLMSEGGLCGSCPHLFFEKKTGEILYQKELFATSPNTLLTEKIIIPKDIISIIVAELEHELTFIDAIVLNDKNIEINKYLETNKYWKYNVNECDEIFITGKYMPKTENYKEMNVLDKFRLIQLFIKKWNKIK